MPVPRQIGRKKNVLQEKLDAQEEMDEANAHPFPNEVKFWTKEDVGFFLTTLGLQQYRPAFEEAAVDGDFLLALDPNDCADVLGVEHPLHSKKLFLAIDKLRPLTETDRRKKVDDVAVGGIGVGTAEYFCRIIVVVVAIFVVFVVVRGAVVYVVAVVLDPHLISFTRWCLFLALRHKYVATVQ